MRARFFALPPPQRHLTGTQPARLEGAGAMIQSASPAEVGIRLPVNCGHRGSSAEAPENTMASFRRAVSQGARMVELDVRLSLDGYPVVFHDDTLERTTNGHGKLEETTLAALRTLDAGSWFDETFAGEGLVTLQEVLDFASSAGIGLDIEMKFQKRTSWYALCDAVGSLLEKTGWSNGFVSSFHHRALHYFKTRFPRIEVARLYHSRAPFERNLRFDLVPQVAVLRHLVVPSLVKRVHRLGGRIHVWTVDDPDEMRRFIRMGVDTIVTNRPAVLQSVLDGWGEEAPTSLPDDDLP